MSGMRTLNAYEMDGGPSGIFWEVTSDAPIVGEFLSGHLKLADVRAAYPEVRLAVHTLEDYEVAAERDDFDGMGPVSYFIEPGEMERSAR
jgi:hypothetical protein